MRQVKASRSALLSVQHLLVPLTLAASAEAVTALAESVQSSAKREASTEASVPLAEAVQPATAAAAQPEAAPTTTTAAVAAAQPATAARSGRTRPVSDFQRRLAEFRERQRLEEEERLASEKDRLIREHEFNFERFVMLKKSYEVETESANQKLNRTVVKSPADLEGLAAAGAFKPMSLAELRGFEYAKRNGDTGSVNGAMRIYRKTASQIYKVKESEVTGDMMGVIGAYMQAKRQADDEIQREMFNDAYQLKEWPGMGFDGFTRRKQEELWSLYNTDGRVVRDKLPNDCGVIHFPGVGEVIVHKSAVPLSKQLKSAWATERWKYLAPLDARQTVADIRRTQGLGAINQILNLIEKIINMKVEATSSADDDFDYTFKLPYVEPHEDGLNWVPDMAKLREENKHRFILSYPAALNHNNILPPYRLRYNLSKTSFLQNFLLELSMNNRISFKSIRDIEDP